jgi:hypothetical protein
MPIWTVIVAKNHSDMRSDGSSYRNSYRNLAEEISSDTTTDINSYLSPYRCFSFAVNRMETGGRLNIIGRLSYGRPR